MRYTTSDDIDGPDPAWRAPRPQRGMDPATRKLALIAGGLGVGLIAVIGAWSMIGGRGGAVPVIEADSRPFRVKPENPGGLQIDPADDVIMSGDSGAANGTLLPPPEAPEPQVLRAQQQAAAAPPPTVARNVPLTAPDQDLHPTAPASATAGLADRPAGAQPSVARVQAPAHVQPAAQASGSTKGKGPLVQVAALGSEEAARAEWQRLSKRLPDLLGVRQPQVSKTEHDGHTYWRLRTGGFSDIAQATAFCEKLRAKGAGCSLATF